MGPQKILKQIKIIKINNDITANSQNTCNHLTSSVHKTEHDT